MENNDNTRFLRKKLLNTREKPQVVRQIHYVKNCYNHIKFYHSPKLNKLRKNHQLRISVSHYPNDTLKSQARPRDYQIERKNPLFSFFLPQPFFSFSRLLLWFFAAFTHFSYNQIMPIYRQYPLPKKPHPLDCCLNFLCFRWLFGATCLPFPFLLSFIFLHLSVQFAPFLVKS